MWNEAALQGVRAVLGCSDRTAESLLKTFARAVGAPVLGVTGENKGFYSILWLTTEDQIYYAILAGNLTVEEIRSGGPTGKLLYREIE